jgi:hypothetical protein
MSKLSTPDWIKEGFDSKEAYEKSKGTKNHSDFGATKSNSAPSRRKKEDFVGKKKTEKAKGKIFKIRKCPKCNSDNVSVVLGSEEGKGKGEWECKKCKWIGRNVKEEEVSEEEFMKYLDEKGEEVA